MDNKPYKVTGLYIVGVNFDTGLSPMFQISFFAA